ncbi:hypothetical protein M3Y99_01407500 [Aphelenchoides fujianensis]|nr:hypothetical protein M3Y99_01407500 [Aphelenchoides fujianensis]
MAMSIGKGKCMFPNPNCDYGDFAKPENIYGGTYTYKHCIQKAAGTDNVQMSISKCDQTSYLSVNVTYPSSCTTLMDTLIDEITQVMVDYDCGLSCQYPTPVRETTTTCGNTYYFDILTALSTCNVTSSTEYSTTTELSTSTELTTSLELTTTSPEASTSTEQPTSTQETTSVQETTTTTAEVTTTPDQTTSEPTSTSTSTSVDITTTTPLESTTSTTESTSTSTSTLQTTTDSTTDSSTSTSTSTTTSEPTTTTAETSTSNDNREHDGQLEHFDVYSSHDVRNLHNDHNERFGQHNAANDEHIDEHSTNFHFNSPVHERQHDQLEHKHVEHADHEHSEHERLLFDLDINIDEQQSEHNTRINRHEHSNHSVHLAVASNDSRRDDEREHIGNDVRRALLNRFFFHRQPDHFARRQHVH